MNTDYQKLLDGALKLIARRPHSRQEILTYLSRKSSNANIISQVVAKLEQIKLIDDAEFARWLVASRTGSRPHGPRFIAAELARKGISSEVPVQVDNEVELASKALAKKAALWSKLTYREFYTKASRFLAYRGFSWHIIESVVKKLYNDYHVN